MNIFIIIFFTLILTSFCLYGIYCFTKKIIKNIKEEKEIYNKIIQKVETLNINDKDKIDYYIEYLKIKTDIRWKAVLTTTMDITIISIIFNFFYKITDSSKFKYNDFNFYIVIIIILFIFFFFYYTFKYILEEEKKTELLKKLFTK